MSRVVRLFVLPVALIVAAIAQPARAADTLFEFYNTPLNHYFLTIDPAEATAIDSGAAGPGWSRTGKTMSAFRTQAAAPAGAAAVCRFYGNQAKGGPNSHFYTAEADECEAVKRDQGWSYERIEFFVIRPVNGTCPANSTPVYRVYNGRFLEKDSNHRYMTDVAEYTRMQTLGWQAEGVVFCAASDAPVSGGDGQCGNMMVQAGKKIRFQLTAQSGDSEWDRTLVIRSSTFNSQASTMEVHDKLIGQDSTSIQFMGENATTYSLLGSRTVAPGADDQDIFFIPPFVYHKQWTLNQSMPFNVRLVPQGPFGEEYRSSGNMTFVGMESVTVPAGTFNACKFRQTARTEGAQSGSVSMATSDIWVAPTTGLVKQVTDASIVVSGMTVPMQTLTTVAKTVQ